MMTKSRLRRALGILLICGLALLFIPKKFLKEVFESGGNSSESSILEKKGSSDGSDSYKKRERAEPVIKDARVRKLFNTKLPGDNRVDNSQIQRYFEAVGRNDKSIITVYWLSGDPGFLEELQTYPDSVPALTLLSQSERDPERAIGTASRLIEIDPTNPMGFYLMACGEAKKGDLTAAMATLAKLDGLPGKLSGAAPEATTAALDALKIMGLDDVESHLYLMSHNQMYASTESKMSGLVFRILDSKQELPEEVAADYASQLLALTQRTLETSVPSTQAARQALRTESLILSKLPPDFEYGENKTVAQRREEIRIGHQEEFNKGLEFENSLANAESATLAEWAERINRDGWQVARDWLIQQVSK